MQTGMSVAVEFAVVTDDDMTVPDSQTSSSIS